MKDALPTDEELWKLAVAGLVVAAGFTAIQWEVETGKLALILFSSFLAVSIREVGQRTVAEWMDASVETELSLEGSLVTLAVAALGFITSLPLIALFPLENSFSGKRYEHWGKSIDVIWMKRQYWIAASGIVALIASWSISYIAGFQTVAGVISVFTVFQLLPFDYSEIPTGKLDGAYILLHSGFMWLTMFGFSLLAAALTVL